MTVWAASVRGVLGLLGGLVSLAAIGWILLWAIVAWGRL